LGIGGLRPGYELFEANVGPEPLQNIVCAHKASIRIAAFNGVVKVPKCLVAATGSSRQAGEIIPESKHILARASLAGMDSYLCNRLQEKLFCVFVTPGLDQSRSESHETLEGVAVLATKSSQLIIEGLSREFLRLLGFLLM